MVDFAKRVEKNCAADLNGEQVVVATVGWPSGMFLRQTAFGLVAAGGGLLTIGGAGGQVGIGIGGGLTAIGAVGYLLMEKHKKTKSAEEADGAARDEGTLAGAVPNRALIIAATEKRLLLFEQTKTSNKPKRLAASFDHSQVSAIKLKFGLIKNTLEIHLSDESVVVLDAVKNAEPNEFVAAYEAL